MPIKILLTTVGCSGKVSLIKEFINNGIEVIGVDSDPLSAGFEFCSQSFPIPSASEPRFIESILQICKLTEPDAIISSIEEEIKLLVGHKELFDKIGVLILAPSEETVEICCDKAKTYSFFKKIGAPVPKIYSCDCEIKFPMIIKPKHGRGGSGIHVVNNFNELKMFYSDDCIKQEFVRGKEYTIDILSDLEGNPISIVPRLRLQTESGISTKGKTVDNQKIISYCEKIVKELKLVGASCIQCIENETGPKFTEINLRFGGGSILGIKADPIMIPNLIKIIKGEKVERVKDFKIGLTMSRYYNEVFK